MPMIKCDALYPRVKKTLESAGENLTALSIFINPTATPQEHREVAGLPVSEQAIERARRSLAEMAPQRIIIDCLVIGIPK